MMLETRGLLAALLLYGFVAMPAAAMTITTEFETSDGFSTGGTADVTIADGSFAVTFSGGQQQQMFDGPSYNNGPAGYLFINGGGGFMGTSGRTANPTGDGGLIDFTGGAMSVSFFAANRANGAATTLRVFGTDDSTLLGEVLVTERVQSPASQILLDAASLGGLIGSIEIDLPGPAMNPPYALAIDTFSATAPVPEPSAALVFALGCVVVGRSRASLKR